MQLNICHLYPDVMNLYGDRGNLIALKQRARWRGITVQVHPVRAGQKETVPQCDIILLGGGEDRSQQAVFPDLMARKGMLEETVSRGGVVLGICGGYQLLGHSYRTLDGQELSGLGLLDVVTVAGERRLTGNVVIETSLGGEHRALVGFENHAGRTRLGENARALGAVVAGHGNNGEDGGEGACQGRVFGTYLHGALLPKNPWFSDQLLRLALQRRYGDVELLPLDDTLEELAHRGVKERVVKEKGPSAAGTFRRQEH